MSSLHAVLPVLLVATFVQVCPARAEHETRAWKGMAPCKSSEHVYFAGPLWADNDPNRAFAANAVGPAIMMGAKQILAQSGAKTLHLRDVELVDGFISASGHWALLRTSNPQLLQAPLPKCPSDIASPPQTAKGCPAWAYPHTSITGETNTGVVGEPIGGRKLEEVRKHATRTLETLMTLTLDANVSFMEKGAGMKSRVAAGIEDLQVQSHVCNGTLWVMGIGRRAEAPEK